jgi:hypothetical protein
MKHELFSARQQFLRALPNLVADFCPEQLSTALDKAKVSASALQGKQGLTLLTTAILSLENLHSQTIPHDKAIQIFQRLVQHCDVNQPVSALSGKGAAFPPLYLLARMCLQTQPVQPRREDEPESETTARLHQHHDLFATLANVLLAYGADANALVYGQTALDYAKNTKMGAVIQKYGGLTGAEVGRHEAARQTGNTCACNFCKIQATQGRETTFPPRHWLAKIRAMASKAYS